MTKVGEKIKISRNGKVPGEYVSVITARKNDISRQEIPAGIAFCFYQNEPLLPPWLLPEDELCVLEPPPELPKSLSFDFGIAVRVTWERMK